MIFPPASLVCAYLRDSGGDTQELSTFQQETAIANYCGSSGLILTRIFTDTAKPGSSTIGRDAFHQMMDHFRHGAPEAGLIIWSYSRFARDFTDSTFFRADLRRRGYLLHSLNDDIPDGNLGKLFEAIVDWKNEQFLEDLSRDVTRGLTNLVSTYGAVPGRPPVGFLRQPVEIGRRRDGSPHVAHRWVPDSDLAPLIRLAFEQRAAGVPLQDIHRQVRLYKTVNCYSTFYSNQLYKGILIYSGIEYPDYCNPIVDPATWQAAQRKQRQVHPRRVNSSYLLSGLVYCARCGAPLSGLTRSGYQSYACTRQHPHKLCDLQPVPAKPLEVAIIDELVEHALDPAILDDHRLAYQAGQQEDQAALAVRRQRLRANVSSLERQLSRLAEAIAQAGPSPTLLTKLKAAELELAESHADLYDMDRQTERSILTQDELLATAGELKAALTSDHATAQTAMRALVSRIVIDREGRRITGMVTYFFTPP